jgi:hypothetical protein
MNRRATRSGGGAVPFFADNAVQNRERSASTADPALTLGAARFEWTGDNDVSRRRRRSLIDQDRFAMEAAPSLATRRDRIGMDGSDAGREKTHLHRI